MSTTTNLWKGAAAGLAAGIAAAIVMDGFQRALAATQPPPDTPPSTEQAADAASKAATGRAIPADDKGLAGAAVHYLTGAGLGLAYGVAAEFAPGVTGGFGTGFSSTVAGLLDEAAVPALGFGPAPWDAGAGDHATSLSSHVVFGLVAEGVRRAARRLLG